MKSQASWPRLMLGLNFNYVLFSAIHTPKISPVYRLQKYICAYLLRGSKTPDWGRKLSKLQGKCRRHKLHIQNGD